MKKSLKPATKKADSPSAQPTSLTDITVDQIPLDLLCDMAHHLIRYKGAEGVATEGNTWENMVEVAALFIMHAQGARNSLALRMQAEKMEGNLAETCGRLMRMLPDVKPQEKSAGQMSFSRGCKRITGLSKREDAERRFYFALPHLRTLSKMPFEHYQKNGFTLEEVGVGEVLFRKLSKTSLRKPYEKTGHHRQNKQGRKKSPKK